MFEGYRGLRASDGGAHLDYVQGLGRLWVWRLGFGFLEIRAAASE